jgi:hypothetical protein
MIKREAVRQHTQEQTLQNLGFTSTEAQNLRRISLTLSRWAEHECNGTIERDENRNNRPFWSNPSTGRHFVATVADRESGAIKRLKTIVSMRNQRVITNLVEPATLQGSLDQVLNISLSYYVQGDPRGAALYILRPGDVPDGADADSYYNRGIAIY